MCVCVCVCVCTRARAYSRTCVHTFPESKLITGRSCFVSVETDINLISAKLQQQHGLKSSTQGQRLEQHCINIKMMVMMVTVHYAACRKSSCMACLWSRTGKINK